MLPGVLLLVGIIFLRGEEDPGSASVNFELLWVLGETFGEGFALACSGVDIGLDAPLLVAILFCLSCLSLSSRLVKFA